MNNYRDRTCKALATYFTVEFAAFCLTSICTFANLHSTSLCKRKKAAVL